MAKLTQVLDGLEILKRYDARGDVASGHDVIYAGSAKTTPELMEKADVAALKKKGWFWSEDEESWGKFT
jgi:hypothetical protein